MLRELVFDAVAAGDPAHVEALCQAHREAIVDEFPAWQQVPPALRQDQAALQRYANGLVTVARIFAERFGDDRLILRLQGKPEDNPLMQWETELRLAREEMNALRYAEATRRLDALLARTAELEGSGPEQLRPVTIGMLADCYFQDRQGERALPLIDEALRRTRELGDVDGIAAYLGNRYEVLRYLGRGVEARDSAEELADVFDRSARPDEAARYRRLAKLAREGAPKNRVVAMLDDDSRVELDELEHVDGRIRFVFERDRLTLRPALALVRFGKQAGGEGKIDEALELFRRAAAADPTDPDARYQEAFTLVMKKQYAEALAAFDACEAIAPGWYHCRSDRWLANELAERRVGHGTFQAMHILEDSPDPPAEKLTLADEALAATPKVGILHLHRGRQLRQLGQLEEAIAAYRAGLATDPEPDAKTRLLVALAVELPKGDERSALLAEAIALGGNLIAAATATLVAKS